MKIITYDRRVKRMKDPEDVQIEIDRATRYVKSLRRIIKMSDA
jgi:hypothetical protein